MKSKLAAVRLARQEEDSQIASGPRPQNTRCRNLARSVRGWNSSHNPTPRKHPIECNGRNAAFLRIRKRSISLEGGGLQVESKNARRESHQEIFSRKIAQRLYIPRSYKKNLERAEEGSLQARPSSWIINLCVYSSTPPPPDEAPILVSTSRNSVGLTCARCVSCFLTTRPQIFPSSLGVILNLERLTKKKKKNHLSFFLLFSK